MKLKTLFRLVVTAVLGFLGLVLGWQKRKIDKQATRIAIQEQELEHVNTQSDLYKEEMLSTTVGSAEISRIQSESDDKVHMIEEADNVQEVIDHTNDDIATWNAH